MTDFIPIMMLGIATKIQILEKYQLTLGDKFKQKINTYPGRSFSPVVGESVLAPMC